MHDYSVSKRPLTLFTVMDLFVYPALRKAGIRFTPIKKITAGFIVGSFSMVWAAVLQYYVYVLAV
jgi:POT family proton-dependent oligopeptide transporter